MKPDSFYERVKTGTESEILQVFSDFGVRPMQETRVCFAPSGMKDDLSVADGLSRGYGRILPFRCAFPYRNLFTGSVNLEMLAPGYRIVRPGPEREYSDQTRYGQDYSGKG
jgi:hypothetical protein